jgi:hypothetical protein
MPRKIVDMYETGWPWLTEEEAEEKVIAGIHAVSLNKIREVAAEKGFGEWYYAYAGDKETCGMM